MAGQLRTITVAKLIDMLQGEDPDALVVFTCDYGDYHHTQQALAIDGNFEEVVLEKSAYSHSGFAVATDDEDLTGDEPKYIALS